MAVKRGTNSSDITKAELARNVQLLSNCLSRYFQIVVLEKTLESPLDCKEIKPVNPKGNQPWIFIGRTDAEAETPILQPPDVKSQLIREDPDAGKDWRQEEKGTTEDEMVSPTQWVWANSERWWRTRKPDMLQSMGSQRVGHNWATEQQQWAFPLCYIAYMIYFI